MKHCLLLLVVILAPGCVFRAGRTHSGSHHTSIASSPNRPWPDEHKAELEYLVRDGSAVLQTDRMKLVFHDLTGAEQHTFHFDGPRQAIQIAGSGSSTVTVSCGLNGTTVQFTSTYANGTNTLQLGPQSVRLTEAGTRLLVGGQTIDLSEGRKTIHLRAETATVE